MPNAPHKCAHCGRVDMIQHVADAMFCLGCGGQTDYQGKALPRDPQIEAGDTVNVESRR